MAVILASLTGYVILGIALVCLVVLLGLILTATEEKDGGENV